MLEMVVGEQIPSAVCMRNFTAGDGLLFALSPSEEPTYPTRYLKGKDGYLAFQYPAELSAALTVGTCIYFRKHLEEKGLFLLFSGTVYKKFSVDQLGVPTIIVRVPELFTYATERRRDPRVTVSVACRIRKQASFKRATIYNLSRGGAYVQCRESPGPAEGQVIELDFRIPAVGQTQTAGMPAQHVEVRIEALVLRLDGDEGAPPRMAIQFVDTENVEKQRLLKAIDIYVAHLILEA